MWRVIDQDLTCWFPPCAGGCAPLQDQSSTLQPSTLCPPMAPLMSWRGAAHVCRLARFQSNAFPPWCLRTAKSSAVLGTRIRCARPPLLIDTDHSAGCGRMDPQVRIMMNHGTYPDCGQQRVAHHATFSDVDGRAVGDRRGSECVWDTGPSPLRMDECERVML